MSTCADLSQAYGIKNYPECSGHGLCINTKCICDPGWTGYTDMELFHGFDCDINILAVRIWAMINVAITSVGIIYIGYRCVKEDILSNKNFYRHKTFAFISFLIANISSFIQCIAKIMDTRNVAVGGDLVESISAVFVTTFYFAGTCNYFIVMIKFLMNYSSFVEIQTRTRIKRNVNLYVRISHVWPIFAFIGMFLSVFLAHMNPQQSDTYNILCTATFVVGYLYLAGSTSFLVYVFLVEIGNYLDQKDQSFLITSTSSKKNAKGLIMARKTKDSIQVVYNKINIGFHLAIPCLIGGVPLNLIFLCWLFMRRKLVFLFMFESTGSSLLSMVGVWSLSRSSGDKKIGTISVNVLNTKLNQVHCEPLATRI